MTRHAEEAPVEPRTIADDEPVMLLVHPALRPSLFAWLNRCGLLVGYAPFLGEEDGLAIYMTSPAHLHKDDPVASP